MLMYIFILATFTTICQSAVLYPQPVGIIYADPIIHPVEPHRAVVENAQHEALLPKELLKSSRFYDDPNIAAALAKESWFGEKEMEVRNREADLIPREKIYEIVQHAGFLDRDH